MNANADADIVVIRTVETARKERSDQHEIQTRYDAGPGAECVLAPVDVLFEHDGERFIAIDTAGVRKKSKLADAIEFFSEARARKTIRRADVVILLFDVMNPLSSIEKNLARYVIDHHKPVVLAANKWDLETEKQAAQRDLRERTERLLPQLD